MIVTLEPDSPPKQIQYDVEYTLNNPNDQEGLVDVITQFATQQSKVPPHSSQKIRITQGQSPPNSLSIENAGRVTLTLTIDPQT